ncbi:MAG TPA: holo-ACP synthase [Gemmatimonadales bacterium]|nr:holo-ACP synthase [Gemmatimonadales bacterium]
MIGVGLDLVDVKEAERLFERWGERLLSRVLTDAEREYVLRFARPARHIAVRLAAKEAVYKAMQTVSGARGVSWRQIEVIRHGDGRPTIQLHGSAARLAEQAGGLRVALSLSHTRRTAAAVALVESGMGR